MDIVANFVANLEKDIWERVCTYIVCSEYGNTEYGILSTDNALTRL